MTDVVVQRRVLPWLDVEKRSGDGGSHVVPVLLHPRPGHRSHPPAPRQAAANRRPRRRSPAAVAAGHHLLAHTVWADSTAVSIDWPTGNPFQTEVAVANLAIGVPGILCYW